MLKMTIVDVERARGETRYGSEKELADYLAGRFWPLLPHVHLDEMVKVLNEGDVIRVAVEPYLPPVEANILPENYLDASQADEPDPWPRRGE